MAELTEDDLLPGEIPASELAGAKGEHTETTTTGPEGEVRREIHASSPDTSLEEKASEPAGGLAGVFDKIRAMLDPKSVTGATAAGVSKGATMNFGDELAGVIGGASDLDEQREKVMNDVTEAKAKGTYGAAPDLPGVTSYTLNRPGMEPQSVVREARTVPAPDVGEKAILALSGGKPQTIDAPHARPGATDEPLKAAGPDVKKAYQQARNSWRKQDKIAEKAQPEAFAAGELGGALAVPVPGVGKAKGALKVAKYMGLGSGIGTVAGLGGSEADLTEDGNLGDAAIDTGIGTAGGAVVGGLLGYGASKLDPWLTKHANRTAFKALDPYMESIAKELGPDATKGEILGEAERLGKRVLDENIIPQGPLERWANGEKLAETALAKSEEAGALKGGYVDAAQDALTKAGVPNPVSLGRLATEVEQAAESAALDPDKQELAKKLAKKATEIRQAIVNRASAGVADPAAQTLQAAEKTKKGFQDAAYKTAVGKRGGSGEEAKKAVARMAKEQAEKAVEAGLGPEELEIFKSVKDRFGDLKGISNVANHGAVRSFRNNAVGLGDKIAGAAAASATHGPAAVPAALAAATAHHLANHQGTAGLARTLSNAAQRTAAPLVPGIEQVTNRINPPPPDEEEPEPWQSFGGRR